LHEIKYDGYRMHARLDRGAIKLLTRTALDWTHKYPAIAKAAAPGEQIADPYLARLQREAAEKRGAIFVVESDGVFAGFAAGWIIERDHIPESEDSNRFGYLSDICVMPA